MMPYEKSGSMIKWKK